MTMPETIWAMPARKLMWTEDNTQGVLVKGYGEYVLRSSVQAMIDAALATPPDADTRVVSVGSLLAAYTAFMTASEISSSQIALVKKVSIAAAFAADAYENGYDQDNAIHALASSFLQALVDYTHPDLDYLRADPRKAIAARAIIEGKDQ